METAIPSKQPKAKRPAISDWENEGGATPPHDFTATRKELSPAYARLRRLAFGLADHVRARPYLSLAAALGVGIVIGGGAARNAKARSVLGLLLVPTLKRVWSLGDAP